MGLRMLTLKSSDSAPSSRLIRHAGDTSGLHFVARTSWASLPLVASYDTRDTKRLAYTLWPEPTGSVSIKSPPTTRRTHTSGPFLRSPKQLG